MDDQPTSMQWMARATEARSVAETMRDSDARSTMLAIAASYEKLARRAEGANVEAPANSTDVYRSSNGDRWLLIIDAVSGRTSRTALLADRSQRRRWKNFSP
jgi:hypothetical protein